MEPLVTPNSPADSGGQLPDGSPAMDAGELDGDGYDQFQDAGQAPDYPDGSGGEELLLGKFKGVDALAKAYGELEPQFSRAREENAVLKKNMEKLQRQVEQLEARPQVSGDDDPKKAKEKDIESWLADPDAAVVSRIDSYEDAKESAETAIESSFKEVVEELKLVDHLTPEYAEEINNEIHTDKVWSSMLRHFRNAIYKSKGNVDISGPMRDLVQRATLVVVGRHAQELIDKARADAEGAAKDKFLGVKNAQTVRPGATPKTPGRFAGADRPMRERMKDVGEVW